MEIVFILLVALIIFGPAKLPEIGRSIGNALRAFKKAMQEFSDETKDEEGDKK